MRKVLLFVKQEEQDDDSDMQLRMQLLNQALGISPVNMSEIPETLFLASIRFSMAPQFLNVQMNPASTLAGILGTLGGMMSLFVFAVSIPAIFVNRKLFNRAVEVRNAIG